VGNFVAIETGGFGGGIDQACGFGEAEEDGVGAAEKFGAIELLFQVGTGEVDPNWTER
jgi:hypothetical protein